MTDPLSSEELEALLAAASPGRYSEAPAIEGGPAMTDPVQAWLEREAANLAHKAETYTPELSADRMRWAAAHALAAAGCALRDAEEAWEQADTGDYVAVEAWTKAQEHFDAARAALGELIE